MMEKPDKDELIEKFLTHDLNEVELLQFKEKWYNDNDFVREVREYSNLIVALKAASKLEQDNENTSNPTKTFHMKPLKYYMAFAASFSLLLTSSFLFCITLRSPSKKELVDEYIINHRLYAVRGEDGTMSSNIKKAVEAYGHGKKEQALALLKNEVEQEGNELYIYTLADLFLELGQPDSAIYYYEKGGVSYPSDPYAHWNKIMSLLQKGEIGTAKDMLEELVASKASPYDKKAQALLDELNTIGFKIRLWFE